MFFWKVKRDRHGWIRQEKVQMYRCEFTTTNTAQDGKKYTMNMNVLVVCDTVEEAIKVCRQEYPENFVLHSVNKQNQRCDLIITDGAKALAEIR